jgi:prepilin-type N-terminal cleavage/methylation domain-containing protein/prepilin-type processing-associated H-X9-DG protein
MNLRPGRKAGLTLIELMVALFIVAIIIALTLAAVMRARESARQVKCLNNLKSISLAINSHLDSKNYYPRGENLYSAFVHLLPYLDQEPLFNSFNLAKPGSFGYSPSDVNGTAYISRVSTFVCPSDNPSITVLGPCSYGGNLGWGLGKYPLPDNGPFAGSLIDSRIRDALVRDGLSNTVAVSEFCGTQGRLTTRNRHAVFRLGSYGRSQFDSMISDCSTVNISQQPIASAFRGMCWAFDGPYNSLYDHDLTPNRPTCQCSGGGVQGASTASSNHPGGVNCAHLDGHVSFIKDAVSIGAWRALGTISGNEIIPND